MPILCQLAQLYLRVVSSSVPVECLFSSAALIANGKRSSLKPYKLEQILFVHALNKEPQAVPLKNWASRNLSHKYVRRNSAAIFTQPAKFSKKFGWGSTLCTYLLGFVSYCLSLCLYVWRINIVSGTKQVKGPNFQNVLRVSKFCVSLM